MATMNILDVYKKESGRIWHRKPLANSDDGILFTITNNVASALSAPARNVRFLHAGFNVSGDAFLAGDYQGNIYQFDMSKNRFTLVKKTGALCTAINFTLRRRTEYLIAMSDYSMKCFDTESRDLVAWMKGHESAIHTVSVHASGRYAITASLDTAQLWDLDTFQRKRKLNIKENVGIVKVFFLPMSNTIMTCFKDDTIFAWELESMTHKYQLHIPDGKPPQFKAFAVTRDGRLLAGGGRSRHLHLWALDTRKLLRIIELPNKITTVKQLEFLPDSFDGGANQVLGVLGQDGIARFLNVNTCKLLFDVGSLSDQIHNMCVSPAGRHITAVMESGNVNVYSVDALTSELNKPPPPLVKVLNNKSDHLDNTKSMEGVGGARRATAKQRASVRSSSGKENKTSDNTQSTAVELPDGLSRKRLLAILKGYGEYPAKYRSFIWRAILHLPENHAAYAALADKGTHSSYEKLHEKYPIKSRKLLRVLQRTLSALAHWSPIFGETDFLPMLAFPFIKLFQNNQLVCFEIIAAVLGNWCSHWFEYFPNPPINILGMVENILAYHDKDLLHHFVRHGITSQLYAWPLLETLFSEVLTRDEWLKLFDNVFSNHPAYLLCAVVAYCTTSRGPLFNCKETDDFHYFFHHKNAVSITDVIKESYRILEGTQEEIDARRLLEPFTPLTQGQYPVFNKYPKFIVDYQVQERERIRQEETDYLQQRQVSMELQAETARRQEEEEAWYRQQNLLVQAETKRREIIADEEKKLAEQRKRLGAMTRELKMKEMQLLDATRRKFLTYQQQQKESELARLDDEIRRKAALRETETQAALEDAEIRNMELQLQRKMFEQELHREYVENDREQKQELSVRQKQQELEDRIMESMARAERDREQQVRKDVLQNLAHAEQMKVDGTVRNQIESCQQLDDLNREQTAIKKAALQAENRELEKSIHDLMQQVETRRGGEALARWEEYEDQQQHAAMAESRRLQLLCDEVREAGQHVDHLDNNQAHVIERLRDLKQSLHSRDDSRDRMYLNESQETDISTQLSLDRGRSRFEENERDLMQEVRNLRSKLARENRHKRAPPPQPLIS